MAEFAYNNAKIASIGYTLFKFKCGYHLGVYFNEDVDSYSRSCFTDKLAEELKELIKFTTKNYSIYKNYRKELIIKK